MIIRTLPREEIPPVWQIDRQEIIENVYYLCNGKLVLEPEYFDAQAGPQMKQNGILPF